MSLKFQGALREEENGRVSCRLCSVFRPSTTAQLAGVRGDGQEDDGKYINIPFRCLSAALIRDYGVDFSKEGVLKDAVSMFNDLPMYVDHWLDVDNWAGRTSEAHWTEPEGDVPGGIDFVARIYKGEGLSGVYKDRQQKLLVGLEEGIINSVSATLTFRWEKSHPELGDREFWELLGDEIDGSIVRMIVTSIDWVGEISLVWAGADRHAKRKLSLEDRSAELDLSLKLEQRRLALANKGLQQTLQDARHDLAQLEAENRELRSARAELDQVRSGMVDEIVRISAMLKDETMQNEGFISYLKTQQTSALQVTLSASRKKLDAAIPLQCAACGSTSIERRSSVVGAESGASGKLDERQFKL